MTVHITQVYVCDLCGVEVRKLERGVPAGCVPEIIQSDVTIKHNSTLVDVCHHCWPDIKEAFVVLRNRRDRRKSDD